MLISKPLLTFQLCHQENLGLDEQLPSACSPQPRIEKNQDLREEINPYMNKKSNSMLKEKEKIRDYKNT